MEQSRIPQRASEVISTLTEVFRHQRQTEIVGLLENAHARFDESEYDNWNGGTYTWTLRLEVPVHIFAAVEPRLGDIEQQIGTKLAYLDRQYTNDHFGDVTISPTTQAVMPNGQRLAPSEIEIRRLWSEESFRLFVSHVSAHKTQVSTLKERLRLRGITAFVAHEDIEPSLEWQREIELALRSMHGLVALIAPGFHESRWTDQEVGWALGRGVVVVPVRVPIDPYGLMGKIQGVRGSFDRADVLADSIAKTLLTNSSSAAAMRRGLIHAFTEPTSPDMARCAGDLLVNAVADISDEERSAVWNACAENHVLAGINEVTQAIYNRYGEPPATSAKAPPADEIPF
jgi:hypothetical protein